MDQYNTVAQIQQLLAETIEKWAAFRKFLHLCASSLSSRWTKALCMAGDVAWGGLTKHCTNSKCLLLLSCAISGSLRKALIGEAGGIVGLSGMIMEPIMLFKLLNFNFCQLQNYKLTIQPYSNFDWTIVVLHSEVTIQFKI